MSYLSLEDRLVLLLAKYLPVTCSRPGAQATWIEVAAPLVGVVMEGPHERDQESLDSGTVLCPEAVLTTPDGPRWR